MVALDRLGTVAVLAQALHVAVGVLVVVASGETAVVVDMGRPPILAARDALAAEECGHDSTLNVSTHTHGLLDHGARLPLMESQPC